MKDNSDDLRLIVGENIRHCRERDFPGKGGMTTCAEKFGVSLQQWSPWELGKRLPKDYRLKEVAKFFDTTVEWLRTRHHFENTGADHAQRIDVKLDYDDTSRFFRQLERAMSHPERGDIIVSITMKPRKKRKKKKRDSV